PYSFSVPIKNTGSVAFSTKVSFYMTVGGVYPDTVVIQPGETYTFRAEGCTLADGGDIRFSVRYDADDPRPPDGARITILDGATCVQSASAPDFPFNGDQAYPIETVKRRNLTPSLSVWSTSGVSSTELGEGWVRLDATSTSGYISTPSPYQTVMAIDPGKAHTEAITVRVPDDAPAAEVEMAAFFYTGSGGELTESRATTGRITVAPGEARDLSLDLDVPSVARGARQ